MYVEVYIGLFCLHYIMMAHTACGDIDDSLGPVTLSGTDYEFLVDFARVATSSAHTATLACQLSGSPYC